jgi:hypothetical protein
MSFPMKTSERRIRRVLTGVLALLGLSGCPAWEATPLRVQQAYGQADRALLSNQIYDPVKARHPAALTPDGLDGQKGESVLQETYRDDVGSPERVRKRAVLGIRNSSMGSGGSGSGVGSGY